MGERYVARCWACVLLALALAATRAAAEPAPDPPRLVAQTGTGFTISVAASPDGKWLLTTCQADDAARLWDVATGYELRRFEAPGGRMRMAVFSPDGKSVLAAGADRLAYLWDARTGKELRRFQGHTGGVFQATFSPDGKRVLTAGEDGTARLWDSATCKELHRFADDSKVFGSAALSADGGLVLTAGPGKSARLWDAATGKEVGRLEGHSDAVRAVALNADGRRAVTVSGDKIARLWDVAARKELCRRELPAIWGRAMTFSPDGRLWLTCGPANDAYLWDAATGKQLHVLRGHTGAVTVAAFSPDGKRALTGGADKTARLWDAESGRELLRLEGHAGAISSAAFLADGKRLLTSSLYDNAPRIWDAATGKELVRFEGHSVPVRSLAISSDGKRLLTSVTGDEVTCLWDLQAGRELRRLAGHPVAFAADGKLAVTGAVDGKPRLWDGVTGKELRRFEGHTGAVSWVAITRDGKHVVTAGEGKTAHLWDATTGKEERRLGGEPAARGKKEDRRMGGEQAAPGPVDFSPDGKRVVTGGAGNTAVVWDASSGKDSAVLKGHTGPVHAVTFSPDGKRVLSGSSDGTARVWDAATGKELHHLAGNGGSVFAVAYSPDGKSVLTGGLDRAARLWDAATGKELRQFQGHRSHIEAVAFTPDGKRVVTGSFDTTARVWDVATGKELCALISFLDGTWAVVDPAGRYDASNGGDVVGLHWVVGDEPIALKQLKERYYDPGLLAKYLGFNKEALRDVAAFDSVKMYPEIAITQTDAKKPVMDVALANRGGGIGKVVVLVNGKELTGDARPRDAAAGAAKLDVRLDLSNDPRLVPGQKNKVEVVAYNTDGYLCSRGIVREFDGPGGAAADPPRLYAVVAGVSKYGNDKMSLRYAAKDADDFATALELAAGRLFGADNVHVTKLTGAAPDGRPTRAALDRALGALKATKPGDLVVVYLAGHGVTTEGQDGEWHYLTADARSAELTDPEVRKQVSVSSTELTDLLKASPARKQVLILDTCHSGRLVEKLTEKRDVPGSQVRALERVKDRTGVYVLAGCAADSVSYEATRYGQGLLTYSLLLGMKGGKLREGEYVDVADLFGFAADKVPELARDIGGVQRPLIASPRGSPFDIGRLTAEDRARVPLQQVKPVVLPSVFQLEKPARDSLGLTKLVNARLREASATPRGARMVYVDADDFPGGVQPSGRYKVEAGQVTVSVSLFEGDKELAAFSVAGTADKPDVLAEKIAAEVEKRLAAAR